MEKEMRGKNKWQMLELPDGITTSSGNWYHITSEGIQEYLPGLLKKYPIEKIVKEADAWLKSADVLSLLLFFSLVLAGLSPLLSAVFSLAFYMLWFFNTSAFVVPTLGPVISFIQSDAFIYIVSAAFLIYFSFVDLFVMWVGVGLFFLYKVGLLRLAVKYLISKTKGTSTQMPDRVLNMLLIRYGLREGILSGTVKEMEQEFIRIVNYHKKNKE